MAKGMRALAVMTKAPRAGQVKTRLVPPLTPDQAAQLNICFLRDTSAAIDKAVSGKGRGIGVYTPVGAETAYIDILPDDFDLLPQRGDHFGQRLVNAANDLFAIGFASVCLIDSDSPTVSAEIYTQSIALLSTESKRVVLGPCEDGGYYLIGMNKPEERLFQAIDWSTDRVLEQTIARANELGLQTELLPTCYDIDDGRALERLGDDLLGERRFDLAPHTREFLADLVARKQL